MVQNGKEDDAALVLVFDKTKADSRHPPSVSLSLSRSLSRALSLVLSLSLSLSLCRSLSFSLSLSRRRQTPALSLPEVTVDFTGGRMRRYPGTRGTAVHRVTPTGVPMRQHAPALSLPEVVHASVRNTSPLELIYSLQKHKSLK